MDVKTMTTLYYTLNRSGFNIIISCKNTKDIWHALEDGNREESSKKVLKCYKYNKTRHVKVDCLLLQNKKKNLHHKIAMKAIWSDGWDSSSSDEEKQVANICFMTIKSKNRIQSMDDELNDVFVSLYYEFKKLDSKYNILKRYCACLLVKK
ncbi:hypothetical protein NC653_017070 [Populus alba x Populus x berolinensis]|uniref:Uncharacterized protein n=1 Tax=Populus alba x Populus x berolinensis TaxID=444605 RepID=A0AAD6QPK5_9ROSI|nr:hypothetical protein NC653_017070 [Populus alba x Populus x berolinensis]